MRARQKAKIVPPPPVPAQVIPEGRQDKIHYFLQKVEDRVVGLIDTDSVKIAPQKIPFAEVKRDEVETIAGKLKRMQMSKEVMQSKLQVIAEEEHELKMKHRQLEKLGALEGKTAREGKEGDVFTMGPRPRSQLSAEDINLLKKLKKEHREFERSLDEKTRAHLQTMQKLRKQQASLQQRRKREQGQVKRREISKRLQVLQKQRGERERQFEEQKRKLIELKARKKLFEQAERVQREKDKLDLEKKVALMESRIKEKKQLDLQSIRSHEEKYRDLREQQRANRERRKEQFEEVARQRREDVSFEKSKYYTIAHDETKKRKQEQFERQREKLDLIEAAKIYAEQIKRDHSPRLKTKSSEQSQEKKAEGLSFEEVKQLGNNYMSQMRKLLKKREKVNRSQFSNESKETTLPLKLNPNGSTTTTKYHDYLSERRMARPAEKMNQTEDSIKDRLIRRDLQDVYRIMNSKEDRSDKLDRVKTIAEKLDVREKGDDHNIIDKISAKLRILQTLADNH